MAMKSTIAALRKLPHPTQTKIAFDAAREYYGLSKSEIVSTSRAKMPLYARWSIIDTLHKSLGSVSIEVLSKALNRHRTSILCQINDYRNRTHLKNEWQRECCPGYQSVLKRVIREHREGASKD